MSEGKSALGRIAATFQGPSDGSATGEAGANRARAVVAPPYLPAKNERFLCTHAAAARVRQVRIVHRSIDGLRYADLHALIMHMWGERSGRHAP